MMDKDMHIKLMTTALFQKMFHGDKHASMSEIINKSLAEYVSTHNDEIESALSEMRKKGWNV